MKKIFYWVSIIAAAPLGALAGIILIYGVPLLLCMLVGLLTFHADWGVACAYSVGDFLRPN